VAGVAPADTGSSVCTAPRTKHTVQITVNPNGRLTVYLEAHDTNLKAVERALDDPVHGVSKERFSVRHQPRDRVRDQRQLRRARPHRIQTIRDLEPGMPYRRHHVVVDGHNVDHADMGASVPPDPHRFTGLVVCPL
jgi:hypothetical protein